MSKKNILVLGKKASLEGALRYDQLQELTDEQKKQAQENLGIDLSTALKRVIVETLPEVGEDNTIYMVARTEQEEGNVYDEYMYINSQWEKIGSTDVDLSGYYTKEQTDEAVNTAKQALQDEINAIPKHWFGTQEEYDNLEEKDENTIYHIESEGNDSEISDFFFSWNDGDPEATPKFPDELFKFYDEGHKKIRVYLVNDVEGGDNEHSMFQVKYLGFNPYDRTQVEIIYTEYLGSDNLITFTKDSEEDETWQVQWTSLYADDWEYGDTTYLATQNYVDEKIAEIPTPETAPTFFVSVGYVDGKYGEEMSELTGGKIALMQEDEIQSIENDQLRPIIQYCFEQFMAGNYEPDLNILGYYSELINGLEANDCYGKGEFSMNRIDINAYTSQLVCCYKLKRNKKTFYLNFSATVNGLTQNITFDNLELSMVVDEEGGNAGNNWYGTEEEFLALGEYDETGNTNYFIEGQIDYKKDIKNLPLIPKKVSELPNDAHYVQGVKKINGISMRGEGNIDIMKIIDKYHWWGTQEEYDALEEIDPNIQYHIEGGETRTLTFTFDDGTEENIEFLIK